jgi:hypothetical protein
MDLPAEVNGALLCYLDTLEACSLRALNKEWKQLVALFEWQDRDTIIYEAKLWRTCFPRASVAALDCFHSLKGTLQYFKGVKCLDISHNKFVKELVASDFSNLRGIHTLIMSGCKFSMSINMEEALSNLAGIKGLDLSYTERPTLTTTCFSYLEGIHELDLHSGVWRRERISLQAISHLDGIKAFRISDTRLSDEMFQYLTHAKIVGISGCNGFTDEAFKYLTNVEELDMGFCDDAEVTDKGLFCLKNVKVINMGGCTQSGITSSALQFLKERVAGVSQCFRPFKGDAFKSFHVPTHDLRRHEFRSTLALAPYYFDHRLF